MPSSGPSNSNVQHGGADWRTAYRDMKDKICVVGAGPSGLSISRAFTRLGIPHDVIE
ncbi:hypothetical protein MNBD_ALPHA04-2226, partial [hydrothermal vent metagenome]